MKTKTNLLECLSHTLLGALFAASVVLAPSVARAESRAGIPSPLHYDAVTLEKDGTATSEELNNLTQTLRAEVKTPGEPIVVLVHGFALKQKDAVISFETVAKRLHAQADDAHLPVAVVGLHWAADTGAPGSWMPQAVGHRLASLFGMKKAVKNPYLEKQQVAEASGRQGLRAVLFRLQETFPGSPVHLWVHSMGAQVALSALCPETCAQEKKPVLVEQPERDLKVGMLTLAGADLDYDLFCRKNSDQVRCALPRADVWWVTVPEKDRADAVLELRRGAGQGDAVGNRGLKLDRNDLSAMVARRGLVVDQGNVPTTHAIEEYYNDRRVSELVHSMLYLQQPENPAGQQSVLAKLDGILRGGDSVRTAAADKSDASCRLYAAWLQKPRESNVTLAGVVLAKRSTEAQSKVAGTREATR